MGAHPLGEFDASRREVLCDLSDVIDQKRGLFPEGDDEGPPGFGVVEVEFDIFQILLLFRIVSVADRVDQACPFPIRQHDHAAVEIEAFLQGIYNEGEQLLDVEDR